MKYIITSTSQNIHICIYSTIYKISKKRQFEEALHLYMKVKSILKDKVFHKTKQKIKTVKKIKADLLASPLHRYAIFCASLSSDQQAQLLFRLFISKFRHWEMSIYSTSS